MKEKLHNIIKELEELSSEIDFNTNGQVIELEHEYAIQKNNNSYSFDITIKRPRHMFLIQDIFEVSEDDDQILIDYRRKTQSIIPSMPKPFPDTLKRKFKFDKNLSENEIFKSLMRKITEFFSEYKYVDQTYKMHGSND